jgi:hypothetical protein
MTGNQISALSIAPWGGPLAFDQIFQQAFPFFLGPLLKAPLKILRSSHRWTWSGHEGFHGLATGRSTNADG